MEMLREAYQKRLSLLHGYINPGVKRNRQTSKTKSESVEVTTAAFCDTNNMVTISALVAEAKSTNADIVKLLKL